MADTDYGVFASVVGIAGTIVAATGALTTLAWRGRRKWEPELGGIGIAVKRIVALVVGIVLVLLWISTRQAVPAPWLQTYTIWFVAVALGAFLSYVALYFSLFFDRDDSTPAGAASTKIVGGFCVTQRIAEIRNTGLPASPSGGTAPEPTLQNCFAHTGYNEDAVWPRLCRVPALLLVIVVNVSMLASGTLALAGGSLLLELSMRPPYIAQCALTTNSPVEEWTLKECKVVGGSWPDLACRANCGDHERNNGVSKSLRITSNANQRIGGSCLPPPERAQGYGCDPQGGGNPCAFTRRVSENLQPQFVEVSLRNWGGPVFMRIAYNIEERQVTIKPTKSAPFEVKQGARFTVDVPSGSTGADLECKVANTAVKFGVGTSDGVYFQFVTKQQGVGGNQYTYELK